MNLPHVYYYSGEHSVKFKINGKWADTWSDWGLIPSSRHSESMNGIWAQDTAIPGVNGQVDLLRYYPRNSVNSYSRLRNSLLNDDRDTILANNEYDIFQGTNGSLSFVIADQTVPFAKKRQDILNLIHGLKTQMRLKDIPNKTFSVILSVDSFDTGAKFSTMSIGYSVLSIT